MFDSSSRESQLRNPSEQQLNNFMKQIFLLSYGPKLGSKAKVVMIPCPSPVLDYVAMRRDTDPKKFGAYTMPPETERLNYKEKESKVDILELRQFADEKFTGDTHANSEVLQSVAQTYGTTHDLPGLSYLQFLLENPDKVPPEMHADSWYFFPGAAFRSPDGYWVIPCATWSGNGLELETDDNRLVDNWNLKHRIVLFKK